VQAPGFLSSFVLFITATFCVSLCNVIQKRT